ncbi:MAG: hypothetical protein WAT12_04665 [Candidatus Nitrotoga sp.]
MQAVEHMGRPRTTRHAANVKELVRVTLEETPQSATHWSPQNLAAHLGTSASAVECIWRDHGLSCDEKMQIQTLDRT